MAGCLSPQPGVKFRQPVPETLGHPRGPKVIPSAGDPSSGKLHGPIEALPQGLDQALALVRLVHARGKHSSGLPIETHHGTGDVPWLVEMATR